jgi:hypothetical protein
VVTLVFVLSAASLSAQSWTLKDSGVGLVVQDAEYDKVLKIAERGTAFDLEKLYAEGALAGKYKGNQAFAAWLVGPHTDTYLNKSGLPTWNYRYTVTWPDGSTYSGGPAGFYVPGFAAVSISVGSVTNGTWKIEWYIVNRDTQETRLVATDTFSTTWGKPVAAAAVGWTLKDSGVGLVVQDAEYDKVLKIAERGTTFNLRKLYEEGALAGRYKGNQAFAAWLVGPHTDTYLDKNGLPIWSYRYTVTWPGGSTYSGGPAGFTSPGFAAVSLSVGNVTSGTWKIEWYIVNRDTRETRLVATDTFTTTW